MTIFIGIVKFFCFMIGIFCSILLVNNLFVDLTSAISYTRAFENGPDDADNKYRTYAAYRVILALIIGFCFSIVICI